ncbi:MAG: ABC transporter ATP-binding protein [Candidatus Treponema excrementipullorum]|nr:ABC transporter ATP-binding protein [Spirochaetia bacterium]MCI6953228.1 ABC transporter ATP-binding protein [Spirochaetia bacterium]MCI7589785.1 ABC transporter ATP-binding protein [Spirochaetia bacterium]MDY2755245.1 ABC transporter ATP-binding protein [Candidatus Treponema excrementipullorum]MDY4466619.1 ABC transporter ATP-binding protein [Candidatus Treponema excrementipullorum]
MENEICIRMKDVKKEYHVADVLVRALQGVSFEVRRGEYITIMGPSGSGKSTLMNMIGCLDRPTSGLVEIGGKNTAEMTEKELAYLRNITVGFVFQQYFLLPSMNILENVMLPLRYQGIDRKESRRMAEEALVKVGLQDRLGHTPSELSGGQKQRAAIARATVTKPSIILADEPTGALDSETGRRVLEIFSEINKQGTTVIIVTHDPNIGAHAPRQISILDGKILQDTGAQYV